MYRTKTIHGALFALRHGLRALDLNRLSHKSKDSIVYGYEHASIDERLEALGRVVDPGERARLLRETYVLSTAIYAYGGYADIDDLFGQQAVERDRTKRETLLLQLQRRMHERVMHAPIFEPVVLHGVGPRVEEPGAGLIPLFAYFGPYEEIRLRKP